MIAISGVPGTGKTTLCDELSKNKMKCISLSDHLRNIMNIRDEEIDISTIESLNVDADFIESHMSHLISDCDGVIILQCDEDILTRRMGERGYPLEKVNENLDAQRSGIIYSESLERLPSNRILTIDCSRKSITEIAELAIDFKRRFSGGI